MRMPPPDGLELARHVRGSLMNASTVIIMLVRSYLVFPTGTLVNVKLELQPGSPPLQFEARVIRTIGTDCMGVQFNRLDAKQSARLQEFLLPLILAAK
jgi:hypothetical protein